MKNRNVEISNKILLVCLGILTGILFFFLTMEIYLRKVNKFGLVKNREETEGHAWLNKNTRYRLAKDVLLGWEINLEAKGSPNCAGYNINSLGFFDRERKIKKEKMYYRIVVVGDSITEMGWYIKYLEELLNENKELHYNFEVWNCGVGGYSAVQYYAMVRNKVIKYNPDMIIIGLCIDEFANIPVFFRNKQGKWICFQNNYGAFTFPVNTKLFVKSYAYRALIVFWRNLIKGKNFGGIDTGRWSLKGILEITKNKNIKLCTVIFPFLKSEYDKNQQEQYKEMKQVFNEYKIPYIDLHGNFENIDDPVWRWCPDDYIHPSEKGHKVIAKEIYNYLMDNLDWWYTE